MAELMKAPMLWPLRAAVAFARRNKESGTSSVVFMPRNWPIFMDPSRSPRGSGVLVLRSIGTGLLNAAADWPGSRERGASEQDPARPDALPIRPYNHIITHMKTTIDLPDDLLIDAKATAARRRTTLKAMVEHALRREIAFSNRPASDDVFALNGNGFPVLKEREGRRVTSETVYQIMEQEGI